MEFREAGGKKRKVEFFWRAGEAIGKVKEFEYVGYVLKENNNKVGHI